MELDMIRRIKNQHGVGKNWDAPQALKLGASKGHRSLFPHSNHGQGMTERMDMPETMAGRNMPLLCQCQNTLGTARYDKYILL